MNYSPEMHHRRSMRMQGYDYTQSGAYFVTICTQGRTCLFGDLSGEETRLNDAGEMIERWWLELANKFQSVEIDEYVVMPNHFHGIILLVGANLCVCPDDRGVGATGAHAGAPLPAVVRWFKTMSTNDYIRRVKDSGWPPFAGRMWQRNYYEHVIRNDKQLDRVRKYIQDNPAKWAEDPENPGNLRNRQG